MGKVPAIWREECVVQSFDVDMFGTMKPQSLLALLLNGCWNCTENTFYAYKELLAKNQIWVLLKLQLQIETLPKWHDRIVLETWGKGVRKFYATRDFKISDLEGHRLACATSGWIILDRKSGHPYRFDPSSDGFPWLPNKQELETTMEKVPEPTRGGEAARYRVSFSDIDVNLHANATKYLQWMIDSSPRSMLEAMRVRSAELSFLAEAALGDEVAVLVEQETQNEELLSIRRPSDSKELARGKIVWEARSGERPAFSLATTSG